MTGEAPDFRLAPGLGVIEFAHRIVVYQVTDSVIAWARILGEPTTLELTAELEAAIDRDRVRAA